MTAQPQARRPARLLRRWIWPPDKWTRLTTVADLAGPFGPGESVLDVGGRAGEMARLLPRGTSCTSANVEDPCDVRIPADHLPFADDAYAVITSCDVLEHVHPDARDGHVAELVRVARSRVVMCFPGWSPEKEAAERRLHATLAGLGTSFDFLDEHVALGLPRVDDVVAAVSAVAPGASVRLWHQQGVEAGDQVLVDAVTAWRKRRLRPALRFVRAWLGRPPHRLVAQANADTSRTYVVIDVGGPARR